MNVWLLAGLVAGLALAMVGLMRPDTATTPDGVVAKVGEQTVTRDEYRAALQAVASDRREPLDAADRRRVLDRLINEALLIEHGLDLDLVRQTPLLRDQLVDAVLQGIRNEADSETLTDDQVRAFFEKHKVLFTGPDLLHVQAVRTKSLPAAESATKALRNGDAPNEVQSRYPGNAPPLPGGPVPVDKLLDYVGPGIADAARKLSEGEVSEPIATGDAYVVLRLHTRRNAEPPPLADVEDSVRHEMRRRRTETLLQERLDALRQRYAVSIETDAR